MSLNPEERRERLKALKDFHQETFKSLGIADANFIPKLAYKYPGVTEKHVGFFPSEIGKGMDIYTELTSSDLLPEDPERTLYKWRFNPNYHEEYEALEKDSTVRYMIPVSELILVKNNAPEIIIDQKYKEPSKVKEFSFSNADEDASMSDITIRDYAAIMWKKPISNKNWLNNLINKS
jgi:hypothetical protein